MNIDTIERRAASQAINLTISMVGDALDMKFPPGETPTESREIMVSILGRTVADLRDAAAKQESVIGWGSQVILKGAKKPPARVEFVQGFKEDDDGWMTITSEFEMTVDEVATHLRNGRRVVWGGTGWRDEQIRRIILDLDKTYRKQDPSFSGTKWNAQPPTRWKVFYVLGMEDTEDPHTMRRVSKAMKAGKRIIDITGSAPVDLTDAYQWVMSKIESGKLRWAKDDQAQAFSDYRRRLPLGRL